MKKMLVLFALFFLCLSLVCAQRRGQAPTERYSEQLTKELQQLLRAALESDYAYRQTAYLCNNIGPRLSGSPQANAAAEYVAAEMRRLGLDAQLEKVMVPHWVRGVETGELTEYKGQARGTTQKIVLTALGGSVATPKEGITAEVIVVENYDQLEALGQAKVAGKIVLYNAKFDRQLAASGRGLEAYSQSVAYRGAGASRAAKLGAVAALNRSAGGAEYRLAHTGSLFYLPDAPKIPGAAVAAEDAELIASLAAQGTVKLHLTLTPQTLPDEASYNVIADVKGSEHPEQVVIVSGHLDSWDLATGAIDDASGVAVAMQTANLIKQLGLKPKRTIRVVAWMNEENGGMGGRTYAQDYKAEVANHIAAIESDLGASHPLGFHAHATPAALTKLRAASALLQSIGAGLVNVANNSPEADISPLDALGVPTFGLWQDSRTYFDYHHTTADTLDKIVPRELAENAAVMAVLAYAIANLPEPLAR
ncbi:MAG: M20/M25/M40 family metallo-hydrolase [Blastocatellia bacterium]